MARGWETPDIRALLRQREEDLDEATMAASAGAYEVPLGAPLRRRFPTGAQDDYREDIPAEYAAIYYDIYGYPSPEKK